MDILSREVWKQLQNYTIHFTQNTNPVSGTLGYSLQNKSSIGMHAVGLFEVGGRAAAL